MTKKDEKQTKKDLLPVYAVVGEDALKRKTVISRLRKVIEATGDLDFNSAEYRGSEISGAEIVAACNCLPFMCDYRLVVVDEVEKLAKSEVEQIIGYLENPSPTTVLLLVADRLAKNTRLFKAIKSVGVSSIIDCSLPETRELPRHVKDVARQKGLRLQDDAAQMLVELVGQDTFRIDAELTKIALTHDRNTPVTVLDIDDAIARTSDVKPWAFLDACCMRQRLQCIELLRKMPNLTPYQLIGMIESRFEELICACVLEQQGRSSELQKELGKTNAWQVKNHGMWAKNYSIGELEAALMRARDAEYAMKSGTNPDEALLRWVIETV